MCRRSMRDGTRFTSASVERSRHRSRASARSLPLQRDLSECRLPSHLPSGLRSFQREEWRRSEEHTSELQSLMRNSYAVFCLKKKKKTTDIFCKGTSDVQQQQKQTYTVTSS